MTHDVANKQIKWQFIKSLEPARIVHVRETALVTKINVFAQVTVRLHTQQVNNNHKESFFVRLVFDIIIIIKYFYFYHNYYCYFLSMSILK